MKEFETMAGMVGNSFREQFGLGGIDAKGSAKVVRSCLVVELEVALGDAKKVYAAQGAIQTSLLCQSAAHIGVAVYMGKDVVLPTFGFNPDVTTPKGRAFCLRRIFDGRDMGLNPMVAAVYIYPGDAEFWKWRATQ